MRILIFKMSFPFLCVLLFPFISFSQQDTINLINGKQIVPKSIYNEPGSTELKYDLVGKSKAKQRAVDKADIFSIGHNDSQIFVYSPDPADGSSLSINQMEDYIKGEREAIKNFKAPMITICGFVLGSVPTVFYLNFFGLLIPPVYTAAIAITNTNEKKNTLQNPDLSTLKDDKNFKDGYKNAAMHKKIENALFGSVSGFAVAAITILTADYFHRHH